VTSWEGTVQGRHRALKSFREPRRTIFSKLLYESGAHSVAKLRALLSSHKRGCFYSRSRTDGARQTRTIMSRTPPAERRSIPALPENRYTLNFEKSLSSLERLFGHVVHFSPLREGASFLTCHYGSGYGRGCVISVPFAKGHRF
jgi:hypothetical protein